jgi:dimethylamine--corrinoid protein Co-methyltransferase
VGAGDNLGMGATHPLAAGMGGIRTAGDLVARMQMSRGMRLGEAKEYVAGKLGCSRRDLSDSYAMEQIRGELGFGRIVDHANLHPGEPQAMTAKFRIAEVLGIAIPSVAKFKELAGI